MIFRSSGHREFSIWLSALSGRENVIVRKNSSPFASANDEKCDLFYVYSKGDISKTKRCN